MEMVLGEGDVTAAATLIGAPWALLIEIVRFHQGHAGRTCFAPNDRGVRSRGQRHVECGFADIVRLK